MEETALIFIILSLCFSIFFSGMEIAFVSANKLHIELQKQQGTLPGKIMAYFNQRPSNFISTTLIGNTLALVVFGFFLAESLNPYIQTYLPEPINNELWQMLAQTLISTAIVLVTAEFLPKSLFMLNPNRLLLLFAIPFSIIYGLLFGVVYIVVHLSKFLIKHLLGLEYSEDKPVFRLTDLNNYIKNIIENAERQKQNTIDANTVIFNNALEFKTVRVRECMIPRTEMTAVEIEDSIEELKEAFVNSGHSKILIYRDSIDDVIGYCHSLELFKKPAEIEDILTPIMIVPETTLANELMIQFINERKSIALVVDEFGGTSGIVTIEDIIEEIFGEIQDEHDDEDLQERQLDDYNYIFSARIEIDYLNEKYNWKIPEGDYDTLGGFIFSITENIPEVNDIIETFPFRIKVLHKTDNKIDQVQFTYLTDEDAI